MKRRQLLLENETFIQQLSGLLQFLSGIQQLQQLNRNVIEYVIEVNILESKLVVAWGGGIRHGQKCFEIHFILNVEFSPRMTCF